MSTESAPPGRPRSEQARVAVLHAVDDLLVEVGYAALTMKGIAERAGVGRQTVYRWWSTKAEVLLEASVFDARQELAVRRSGDAGRDLAAFVRALERFLTRSDAGTAYRALLGEAQHDPEVAALLHGQDVVAQAARELLRDVLPAGIRTSELEQAVSRLVGPTFYAALAGRPVMPKPATIAASVLTAHSPRKPQ